MTVEKKKNIIYAVFSLLLAAGIGFFFWIVFRQIVEMPLTDHPDHINFAPYVLDAILGRTQPGFQAVAYPLFHLMVYFISRISGHSIYAAGALVLTMANVAAFLLLVPIGRRVCGDDHVVKRIALWVMAATSLIFMTLMSDFLTEGSVYIRQGGANPLHNPTMIAVRPLGILAFLCFCLAAERYAKEQSYYGWMAAYGVCSILSILTKPSYAFVLIPALGLETLVTMIRRRRIDFGIPALIATVPSLLLILWQYRRMNQIVLDLSTLSGMLTASMAPVAAASDGEGFRISSFYIRVGGFSGLGMIDIIKASIATFPVPILLFSAREWKKNVMYRVSLYMLLFGWLETFFLYNGASGDFSWGYFLAVHLATFVSLAASLQYKNKIRPVIAYAAYAYQVWVGLYYLGIVLLTGTYQF